MKRPFSGRLLFAGAAVLVVVASVAVVWRWASRPKKEPTALQIMARPSGQAAEIVVGANVQVSAANARIPHGESVVAADPTNPARLLVAVRQEPPDNTPAKVVVYRSDDGGANWRLCFDRRDDPIAILADPSLAFGPDDILYLACRSNTDEEIEAQSTMLGTTLSKGGLLFFRSADGGKTWEPASNIRQYTDRPFLAVDCSTAQYRGRLYCVGDISSEGKAHLALHMSEDQGKTFLKSHALALKGQMAFGPGNPVVLSDGALAVVYYLWARESGVHPEIHVLFSEDGGQSARESTRVPTYWYDPRILSSNKVIFPMLAADTASPQYHDRLYVVWEDGSPRARIMFAFSTDKGKSWVGPTILSEQPAAPNGERDYSAFTPSVAVNKEGAVAVTWYDRRGFPDDGRNPPGCNVRVRLSLDGGETWQRSVHINEQPITASGGDAADKAGIVADANGVFHPVWIDDRTGVRQVWTTTVEARRINLDQPIPRNIQARARTAFAKPAECGRRA